jgi:hypothetical protein
MLQSAKKDAPAIVDHLSGPSAPEVQHIILKKMVSENSRNTKTIEHYPSQRCLVVFILGAGKMWFFP